MKLLSGERVAYFLFGLIRGNDMYNTCQMDADADRHAKLITSHLIQEIQALGPNNLLQENVESLSLRLLSKYRRNVSRVANNSVGKNDPLISLELMIKQILSKRMAEITGFNRRPAKVAKAHAASHRAR
jgi:hypothetical protein